MKCPKCGGKLQFIEEVSGVFVYPIEGKTINYNDSEFFGDSWPSYIECLNCKESFDWNGDDDNVELVTKEESI